MMNYYLTAPLAHFFPSLNERVRTRGPFIPAITLDTDIHNFPKFLTTCLIEYELYDLGFELYLPENMPSFAFQLYGTAILPPTPFYPQFYPALNQPSFQSLTNHGGRIFEFRRDPLIGSITNQCYLVHARTGTTYWIYQMEGVDQDGLVKLHARNQDGLLCYLHVDRRWCRFTLPMKLEEWWDWTSMGRLWRKFRESRRMSWRHSFFS